MESVRHGDPVIDCLLLEWIITPIMPYPDGETTIKPFMVSMGVFVYLKRFFYYLGQHLVRSVPHVAQDFCRMFYLYLSRTAALFFLLMEILVLSFLFPSRTKKS